MLLVMIAGTGFGSRPALAQEPCLTAPNAPASAGSHWYYHTDPSTQRRCWYMRPRDQATEPAPRQSAAGPAPIAKPVARTAPALAVPDPAAWANPADQPDAANVAWPAPPPPPPPPQPPSADDAPTSDAGDGANVAPPAPPPPPPAPADVAPANSENASSADSPPPPAAASAPAVANPQSAESTALSPAAAAASGQGEQHVTAASEKDKPAAPPSKVAIVFLLAGLMGLLLAGLVLRAMVAMTLRALMGRREIKVARQEPRLIENASGKRSTPARIQLSPSLVPGQSETNVRITEVEEALRQFAHRLQQRRSRQRNVFARVGAWVRS